MIGIGQDTDVAVVRAPGLSGTEPLKIARDRKGEIGDEVLALGSPLGFQNTVTTGIISGIDRILISILFTMRMPIKYPRQSHRGTAVVR